MVVAGAVQQTSAGSPLANEIRNKMELALGTELSDVRVHNGVAAHRQLLE